jgi:hypothetical protein
MTLTMFIHSLRVAGSPSAIDPIPLVEPTLRRVRLLVPMHVHQFLQLSGRKDGHLNGVTLRNKRIGLLISRTIQVRKS